ncbi:MAG: hypothetical protein ABW213_14380 [Tardiphaga sp.]
MIKSGFKAPFAPRLPVAGGKTDRLREKGSTFEAVSIAVAHILAVVAMMVIATMVICVR